MRERAAAKGTRRFGHPYVFGKNGGVYSLGATSLWLISFLVPVHLDSSYGRVKPTDLSLMLFAGLFLLLLYGLLFYGERKKMDFMKTLSGDFNATFSDRTGF